MTEEQLRERLRKIAALYEGATTPGERRAKRQRYTTVVVQAPASFVNQTLWPEYQQLREALNRYLNQATDRIIREEVYCDVRDAPERS